MQTKRIHLFCPFIEKSTTRQNRAHTCYETILNPIDRRLSYPLLKSSKELTYMINQKIDGAGCFWELTYMEYADEWWSPYTSWPAQNQLHRPICNQW